MKLLWILVVLLVAGCVSGKKVIKMIKLKDFHREGPFIFLTKIVLGAGTSQVDLSYQYSSFYPARAVKFPPNLSTTTSLLVFYLGTNIVDLL
jgi:hypothetical protein